MIMLGVDAVNNPGQLQVSASNITQNTAHLFWTQNDYQSLGYSLTVKDANGVTVVPSTPLNTNSFDLAGLQPGMTYIVNVQALYWAMTGSSFWGTQRQVSRSVNYPAYTFTTQSVVPTTTPSTTDTTTTPDTTTIPVVGTVPTNYLIYGAGALFLLLLLRR